MFRFFAVALVVAALFGTLYFSGNALEAWESPKPETVAMPKLPRAKPKPKRHARPKAHVKPVKRVSHAKPTWLVDLNATCRRGKRETESIPQASAPQGVPRVIKRVIRLNARMNRETAELVSRSGNAAATAKLRSLYAQDEALLQRILKAAEQGRYRRLPALSRSLVALARAENTIFVRLGAGACTASPDDLQL